MLKVEVWERQKGETALQYSYFKIYLELGVTRTVEIVQQKCNKSASYFQKLSSKHSWVVRADAYDRYLEEIAYKQNIEAIKKANKQNIELAKKIKYVANKKTQNVINKLKQAQDSDEIDEILADLSWNMLSNLIKTAVDIEQKSFGVEALEKAFGHKDETGFDAELTYEIIKEQLSIKLAKRETKKELASSIDFIDEGSSLVEL